jgi:chorismate dehydratase
MSLTRLGAVGYLNARPLVYGLERVPGFQIRYDIPSECARLLHARDTDIGLIPSIEYLRGPSPYTIVPGAGVTSRGPVASVAVYTARDPCDIGSIAMDNSSRTSVALATILLRRQYGVSPRPLSMPPDLDAMLSVADAALINGAVPRSVGHSGRAAAGFEDRSRKAVDRRHRTAIRLRVLGRVARRGRSGAGRAAAAGAR